MISTRLCSASSGETRPRGNGTSSRLMLPSGCKTDSRARRRATPLRHWMCPFWCKLFGILCLSMFFGPRKTCLVALTQVGVVVGEGSAGSGSGRCMYACATALTCSGPAPSSARTPKIWSKCGSRDIVPRLFPVISGRSLASKPRHELPAVGKAQVTRPTGATYWLTRRLVEGQVFLDLRGDRPHLLPYDKEHGPRCGHGADLGRSARMGSEPGVLLRLRREAGGRQGPGASAPVLPRARRAAPQVAAAGTSGRGVPAGHSGGGTGEPGTDQVRS